MPVLTSSSSNDFCFAGEFLRRQAQSLRLMAASLDAAFSQFVEIIAAAKGKVGVFGVGGKRHLAHRLANRFSATGTPSFYISPEDINLGNNFLIAEEDILLCLFNDEDMDRYPDDIFNVVRKNVQILTIANRANEWIENVSSALLVLPGKADAEQDVETESHEDQLFLAVGDMLALSLMNRRRKSGFGAGAVEGKSTAGRRVRDVMGSSLPPLVSRGESVRMARILLRRHAPCVVGVMHKERLVGVVSDSDFRRVRGKIDLDMPVERIMHAPKTVEAEAPLVEAVLLLKQSGDSALVVTRGRSPIGLIGALDCLKA